MAEDPVFRFLGAVNRLRSWLVRIVIRRDKPGYKVTIF
jgi:hypothetical protein